MQDRLIQGTMLFSLALTLVACALGAAFAPLLLKPVFVVMGACIGGVAVLWWKS